jgi:acetyltransferase
LRRLRRKDESRLYDLFSSCTRATLFQRFHYTFNVSNELAAEACRVDENRRISIVAEVKSKGAHRLIGLCLLVFSEQSQSVEFAILIIDDWQGKGLGRLMTLHCLDVARVRGARRMTAVTTPDNFRMMNLFKELGFNLDYDGVNGIIWAAKSLPPEEAEPSAWKRTA